jgi:hypothetical protein
VPVGADENLTVGNGWHRVARLAEVIHGQEFELLRIGPKNSGDASSAGDIRFELLHMPKKINQNIFREAGYDCLWHMPCYSRPMVMKVWTKTMVGQASASRNSTCQPLQSTQIDTDHEHSKKARKHR